MLPTGMAINSRDVLSVAAVVSTVLVPVLLARFVLAYATGGGQAAIVNGELRIPPPDGALGFAALAITVTGWGLAVSAAVLVTAGAARGRPVGPWPALIEAARRLPTVLAAVLLAAAAALLGAHLFSVVLASGENAAAVPAGLLLGLLVVAVATWMPMVLPATLLGGARGSAAFAAAQATVRGSLRTRVATLFALVGVPLVLVVPVGWLRGSLAERPRRDGWGIVEFAATELAFTAALLVVAAWQGAILARVYLRRVTEGEVDARLERDGGRRRACRPCHARRGAPTRSGGRCGHPDQPVRRAGGGR